LEIREVAYKIGKQMKENKVEELKNGISLYKYVFLDTEETVKCKDENIDLLTEYIFQILDRLREFNKDGLTTDKVMEFVNQTNKNHKHENINKTKILDDEKTEVEIEAEDLFWPTLEAFTKDGIFGYDEKLFEAIYGIARLQGYVPNTLPYLLLKGPVLMSFVMCIAINNMEINDEDYEGLAYSGLKAIMLRGDEDFDILKIEY
jgi:hypothetical protein